MSEEHPLTEGLGKVTVTVWTTAKGRPQWRVRVTEEADDELAASVAARAVSTFYRVGEELATAEGRKPFMGQEPAAA